MRSCTIEIITENDGEVSRFFEEATFAQTEEGESVRYAVDGDEGELFFRDDGCAMRRCGKSGMYAEFRENEETKFSLESGAFQGRIPVHTTYYRLQRERGARRIELFYDLSDGAAIAEYRLHIHIKFVSEEK